MRLARSYRKSYLLLIRFVDSTHFLIFALLYVYAKHRHGNITVRMLFFQCVEHGFPHKPSAITHDPKLKLLAIGTKTGAVRVYPWLALCMIYRHSYSFVTLHLSNIIFGNYNNIWHLWKFQVMYVSSVVLNSMLKCWSSRCGILWPAYKWCGSQQTILLARTGKQASRIIWMPQCSRIAPVYVYSSCETSVKLMRHWFAIAFAYWERG